MKGYVYVIVREDLSGPQKVVQAVHAAIEACRNYLDDEENHPSVIVLGVKNEEKLKKVEWELYERGDCHYEVFREPDRGLEMTAIATGPLYGGGREIFKRYQLLKF